MKKIITFSIFCLFMLAFNTGKAQVFSDGFESWSTATPPKPTNWWGSKTNFSKADSTSQYTTSTHSGTYACKLQSRTTSAKRFSTIPQTIAANTTYTISFWLRGHGTIRTGIWTGGTNSGTAYVYNPNYITINSTTWTQETQTIASDTNSTIAQFILSVKSTFADLEDIQVDDVNITAATIPVVSLKNIQFSTTAPYASPYNGQPVITGGVVSARNTKSFFIQDGYGPWNGLYVYDSIHAAAANLAVGDSITLTGTVSEYYRYTELGSVLAITKVSSGNTVHPAYPVSKVDSTDESLEGVLVTLTNLPCVDTTGTAKYGEFGILNGTDSTETGGLLYKYTTALIGTNYDVTGVVYFDFGTMRVEPRNAGDVSVITGINEFEKSSISVYPNPTANILYVNNMSGIESLRISNILGETIQSLNVSGNHATINVRNLLKGLYFISLINTNGTITTKKFTKE